MQSHEPNAIKLNIRRDSLNVTLKGSNAFFRCILISLALLAFADPGQQHVRPAKPVGQGVSTAQIGC